MLTPFRSGGRMSLNKMLKIEGPDSGRTKQNSEDAPPIEPVTSTSQPMRRFFHLKTGLPSALAGVILVLLSSCHSAPVPLSDQSVLDRASLQLPDTFPPGSEKHSRMVRVLQSIGFSWNNPRFTLGHHLTRGNEVAWFDRSGRLHVTRYTGVFRETGYRIRRYVPSPSGDLEHRGYHLRGSLLLCLFNRPASALHWHKQISSVDLLAELAVGAPIDILVTPASLPLCLFSDRQPSKFLHVVKEPDDKTVRKAREIYQRMGQKGNPIPTYVTAPASVE